MIASFGDQGTEDIFHGRETRHALRFQRELWRIIKRKLDMVNAATTLQDLKAPPNNQLETLKDDLRGYHSIRVNRQLRIIFKFNEGTASDVSCRDYH